MTVGEKRAVFEAVEAPVQGRLAGLGRLVVHHYHPVHLDSLDYRFYCSSKSRMEVIK